MRFIRRATVPTPADRGQAFIGPDLDDLITTVADAQWIAALFHGAATLADAAQMPQGQLLQDAIGAGIVTRANAPLTFLEIGGGPPRNHSNTYALDHAGWTGVVVEPNPKFADEYSRLRTARTTVIPKGVSTDGAGTATLIEAGELSYVAGVGAPPADVWSDARNKALSEGSVRQIVTIHPRVLWSEVVDLIGVPSFMSVDVEGAELAILRELPLEANGPLFVCAEHSGDADRETELERQMSSFGYQRVLPAASQWDGWFVRADVPALIQR